MKSNRRTSFAILGSLLAAGLVLASGCAEEVTTELTDANKLRVYSVADTFEVDISDLDNFYTEELSWDWEVTASQVHVLHRSFVPHGEHHIRLLDAEGDTVYDRHLLWELEGDTEEGEPGTWTVILNLYGVTGRVGLTLTGNP